MHFDQITFSVVSSFKLLNRLQSLNLLGNPLPDSGLEEVIKKDHPKLKVFNTRKLA